MTREEAKSILQQLPEPYRSQAISNVDEHEILNKHNCPYPSKLCQAIDFFAWERTPEGHVYWHELYEKLENLDARFNG